MQEYKKNWQDSAKKSSRVPTENSKLKLVVVGAEVRGKTKESESHSQSKDSGKSSEIKGKD